MNNPVFKGVRDYTEIYPHLLLEIEHFFSVYKELEAKSTQITGWHNADSARKTIDECQKRYLNKNSV